MSDPDSIQGRIEREEFARGHIPDGASPVEPRSAATTVLARPGDDGPFELLLLKRPMTSRFAAGAYVFPGGVVDEADGAEFWIDRVPDMPNLPGGGRAAVTAAIRELFEETGILLSDGDCGATDAASRERSRAISSARTALLAEDRSFVDVTRELSATFTAAPMTYFARWVTPRRLSRRYDALFFLVALPGRDQDVTITEEHDEASWVSAAKALEGFRSGEFPMLFPTWKTIEELASFADLEAAAAVLGSATVETIEPFLDVRGNTVQPRMPDGA